MSKFQPEMTLFGRTLPEVTPDVWQMPLGNIFRNHSVILGHLLSDIFCKIRVLTKLFCNKNFILEKVVRSRHLENVSQTPSKDDLQKPTNSANSVRLKFNVIFLEIF